MHYARHTLPSAGHTRRDRKANAPANGVRKCSAEFCKADHARMLSIGCPVAPTVALGWRRLACHFVKFDGHFIPHIEFGVSDRLVSCGVRVRGIDDGSRSGTRQQVDVFARIARRSSLWSRGHMESPLPESMSQHEVQQQKLIDRCSWKRESRSDQPRDRHTLAMPRISGELQRRSSCLVRKILVEKLSVEHRRRW